MRAEQRIAFELHGALFLYFNTQYSNINFYAANRQYRNTYPLSLCLSVSRYVFAVGFFSTSSSAVCVSFFSFTFSISIGTVFFFHFIWIAEHLYESFVCCFILLRFMCIFSIQKWSNNASKLYSNRKLTSQCKREKSTNVLQKNNNNNVQRQHTKRLNEKKQHTTQHT